MVEAGVESTRRRLTVLEDAPCKTGCSGCCRRMVHITLAEAIVMQKHLEDGKVWPSVLGRCLGALQASREASPTSWFRMNVECPVLSKDECLAYEVRPAACAVHFALSKPELCHPWSTESGEYSPVELEDVFAKFRATVESIVDAHGILAVKLHLPMALIMAERIRHQPGLTPESLLRIVINELRTAP